MTPLLYPAPAQYLPREGCFQLPQTPVFYLSPEAGDARILGTIGRLGAGSPRLAGAEVRVGSEFPGGAGGVNLILESDGDGPAQGYVISVNPDQIECKASDLAGLHYALLTLGQCLAGGTEIPCCTIVDSPAFPVRGYTLDVSRCKVPTMKTFRRLLDICSDLKINQVQFYFEHTFAYSEHPVVWGNASPLTADEVRELDRYCLERFIDLVPSQNTFGHMERWLMHPEYHHLAECPGGFEQWWGVWSKYGMTLKADDASLRFVEGLFDELLPLFSSRQCNISCDEPWELGLGASRERCAREGKHAVYVDYLSKVAAILERGGRTGQFAAEVVLERPEMISQLPKNLIGLVWGYEAGHPFDDQCLRFKRSDMPFYVCSSVASHNAIGGRFENCMANVREAALAGQTHGADGYLVTDWGDGGHHQTLPISYPGLFAGAAFAWNPGSSMAIDALKEILNQRIFKDPAKASVEALINLGKTAACFSHPEPNANLLNQVLFSRRDSIANSTRHMKLDEVKAAEELVQQARQLLQQASPEADDGNALVAELNLAADMLLHAIGRAKDHLLNQQGNATRWRRELIPILGRYEEVWLGRNRPGGLHESTGRLKAILDSFTQ
ncbi:MAG TPA: glycoside hydrolase family 20 zincin-like fold domain-containing protein [Chthoniobacteraceae bacterium]|jgi:hypothetical protein|nr:glycoside hydrolase family 20 zincin-like fold domain-containing protein [Chthoniobacteraceae bacterium]